MLAPRKKLHITPQCALEQSLELLQLNENDVLLDIGCGDGRALITAARVYKCRAIGIEIEPERAAKTKAAVVEAGLSDLITIHQGNAMEFEGFREATAVYLFLTDRGLRCDLLTDPIVPVD
jgi:cyclopropane fatty-acyl-phospholipid synthase-like methyltransferase